MEFHGSLDRPTVVRNYLPLLEAEIAETPEREEDGVVWLVGQRNTHVVQRRLDTVIQ